MDEIKDIELVLENCEIIKIRKENLGIFMIDNIKRSIRRVAVNSISSGLYSDKVVMQINAHANENSFSSYGSVPFDRLREFNDIAAVYVNYKDGHQEGIYVDWNPDSEHENSHQTSIVNEKTGDLYLVICANETVQNFFEEELDSEDEEFWQLYQ